MDHTLDLIFALLAIEAKGVSREAVAAVNRACEKDDGQPFPDRLGQTGVFSPADLARVRRSMDALVSEFDGNEAAALASLGGAGRLVEYFARDLLSEGMDPPTAPMLELPFAQEPWQEISPLQELPGRYRSISERATGSMGRVLLVRDTKMGRDIALKELIPPSESGQPLEQTPAGSTLAVSARFLQEGRVTAALDHPAIVPVYELGQRANGNLYYTMRLVKGRTLSEALRQCRSLEDRLGLLPHFVDLCQAIAYAHSRGVIHRDIKPSNVMVGEFGETVVLDWGLAKIKRSSDDPVLEELRVAPERILADDGVAPQTVFGSVMGTARYMSPEQAQGLTGSIDELSDVYSLGVVLYEILTGTVPFEGGGAGEVLRRLLEEEPDPVLVREPQAPPELASICELAMRRARDRRCRSAKDLADDVQRYLTGALVKGYEYSVPELVRHFYRKHRAMVNTALAAAAVVIVAGVVSYAQVYAARDRERAQRLAAEGARDLAVVAERRAEEAREQAEHRAYVAQIRLAQAYVRERNFGAASRLLWDIPAEERGWEWGCLLEQCHQDLFTVRGHEGILFRVLPSPDGQWILTLAGDRTARLFRVEDGQAGPVIRTPTALFVDGDLSPDGAYVALALHDGTARLYDAATGKELGLFEGHAGAVNSARFFADGARLVTSSNDRTVRLWDTATRREIARLEGHEGELDSAYGSADGAYIVSVTRAGKLRLWRAGEGTPMQEFSGTAPEIGPSGSRVAFVQDGAAVVWDLAGNRELSRLGPAHAEVRRVRFTPDGERVLTVSSDGVAQLYSLADGGLLASFNHGETPKDVRMSLDGRLVLVLSDPGLVTVWDAATGGLLNRLEGHEAGVAAAEFTPDGRRIVTASRDQTARVWDARTSLIESVLLSSPKPILDLADTPDAARVAVVSQDRTLRLIDGRSLRTTAVHAAFSPLGPAACAVSADGRRVAVPLDSFTVFVMDADSGALVSTFSGHDGCVDCLAMSPDGELAASGGRDGTARIWRAGSGEEVVRIEGHGNGVKCVAFSPDGRRLATASLDGTVGLWDATSGAAVHRLQGHASGVNHVTFSPDGLSLVSSGSDGAALRWSTETGELEGRFTGHAGEVACAAYSPDGRRLATASWDHTVRVWDAATFEELLLVTRRDSPVLRARFTSDGRRLLIAGYDGLAAIRNAAPWSAAQFQAYAGATERERYEDCKRRRMRERAPLVEATPATVVVHTTPARLRRQLGLLRQALEGAGAADVAGLVLTEGPRANAAARLCLEPGDAVTAIGDTPIDGPEAARRSLDALLAVPDPWPPVTLAVRRGGREIRLRYELHEPRTVRREVALSRDEARAIVKYIDSILKMGQDSLLSVNHAYDARIGEPPETLLGLSGFWLPGGGPSEGARHRKRLGLGEGDRILSVNGGEIRDFGQLVDFAAKAQAALDGTEPLELSAAIERGEFQTIDLRVRVE